MIGRSRILTPYYAPGASTADVGRSDSRDGLAA